MGLSVMAYLLLCSSLTSLAAFAHETERERFCAEKGFAKSPLCSDCNGLEEYVKDEELVAECRACCVHDSSTPTKEKYKRAVLEVCQFNIGATPHIEEFVEKKLKEYPNLQVRYKIGAHPRLHLSSRDRQETIRIDHWKTEEIEEYLKDRLDAGAVV